MDAFPKTLTLRDTGERRWPKRGELYMWAHPDSGEVDGPHFCHDDDDESWYGRPECFAILAPVDGIASTLDAVLHQMEHGEASDLFDLGIGIDEDTQRDLLWCRDELKSALKSLT